MESIVSSVNSFQVSNYASDFDLHCTTIMSLTNGRRLVMWRCVWCLDPICMFTDNESIDFQIADKMPAHGPYSEVFCSPQCESRFHIHMEDRSAERVITGILFGGRRLPGWKYIPERTLYTNQHNANQENLIEIPADAN